MSKGRWEKRFDQFNCFDFIKISIACFHQFPMNTISHWMSGNEMNVRRMEVGCLMENGFNQFS